MDSKQTVEGQVLDPLGCVGVYKGVTNELDCFWRLTLVLIPWSWNTYKVADMRKSWVSRRVTEGDDSQEISSLVTCFGLSGCVIIAAMCRQPSRVRKHPESHVKSQEGCTRIHYTLKVEFGDMLGSVGMQEPVTVHTNTLIPAELTWWWHGVMMLALSGVKGGVEKWDWIALGI